MATLPQDLQKYIDACNDCIQAANVCISAHVGEEAMARDSDYHAQVCGVCATVDGRAVLVGSLGFLREQGIDADAGADVILMSERLSALPEAFEIGERSFRKTKQNLVLAFSFNGLGVPLAVTGWVHPVWAMIAMAASVTAVLANSFGGRLVSGTRRRGDARHLRSAQHELRALRQDARSPPAVSHSVDPPARWDRPSRSFIAKQ